MPPAGGHGRKKALLVGCCYPGTSAALNGCINDVQCIQYCLKNRFGFSDASFMVLRDDTRDPATSPTRANIMRGIQWLMSDQRPGGWGNSSPAGPPPVLLTAFRLCI
jgi:hypothetical protein